VEIPRVICHAAVRIAGRIRRSRERCVSIVYVPGDSGTLYVVDLGGHQVLVDVPNQPDSQAQFQTLHFVTA
jgi:hypothetical protein